jgi:hypothetical protein
MEMEIIDTSQVCFSTRLLNHWRPKVEAELNGHELKLVTFHGVFPGMSINVRMECPSCDAVKCRLSFAIKF